MSLLKRLLLRVSAPPQPGVFISGMPKSGTTVILRLMGLATGESTLNDPFYKLDQQGVDFRDALFGGQLSVLDLMRRYPKIFQGALIKDPNIIFFADELASAYPDASWVYTIRDPRDNIRSILNRLRLPGRVQAIEPQLAAVPGAWRLVLEGRSPAIAGRDPIERMAHRWLKMAEIMNAAGEGAVVSRYEDFMQAKEERIAELCRAIGLDPVHSIAEHVDTQFQPKGDRRSVWTEFYGAEELATIDRVCEPMLERFGYAPAAGA